MGCSVKRKLNMHVENYYVTKAQLRNCRKRTKKEKLSTITVGHVFQTNKKKKHVRARILFDSSCGATIVNKSLLRKKNMKKDSPTQWNTKAGTFTASKKGKFTLVLPAFDNKRKIQCNAYVDEAPRKNSRYDIIIGRDLLETVGIDLLFSKMKLHGIE